MKVEIGKCEKCDGYILWDFGLDKKIYTCKCGENNIMKNQEEQRYLVLVHSESDETACLPINLDDDELSMVNLIPEVVSENQIWICVKAENPSVAGERADEIWNKRVGG